jgi:hypothetical protein
MIKNIALSMTLAMLTLGVTSAQSGKSKIDNSSQPKPAGEASSALATTQSFTGQFGSYSVNQVLTKNVSVGGHYCHDFPVNAKFTDASQVSISILSYDSDLSNIRIIPFFAIPGDYYYSAVDEIFGSNFKYFNQGGGTVPVYGEYLLVRVCNDNSWSVNITQLNVHAVNSSK